MHMRRAGMPSAHRLRMRITTPPPGYVYPFEFVDRVEPANVARAPSAPADDTQRVLHLRILSGGLDWVVNRVFENFPIVIGRDASCDARVLDVGLGAQVSRFHACIDEIHGDLLVTDLGSTNGTFVRRRRLLPRVPKPLGPGACVHFYVGPLFVIGWHEPKRCSADSPRYANQGEPR